VGKKNSFADWEAGFDSSKLPSELRTLAQGVLVLVLREVEDRALGMTHDHAEAMDVLSEVLCRLVSTHRWNPDACSLREHAFAMADLACRELRHGSKAEKGACAFYAQEQGKLGGSAEDLALYVEEQSDLERLEAERKELARVVRASVAGDELATRVCVVWEERGYVPRRDLVGLLGASDTELYNALKLIRCHARRAQKALRKKGRVS
jgi:hypothetical protein